MATQSSPSRLVIVPCDGRKSTHRTTAGEMYRGPYHRAARRAARTIAGTGGRVVILSAKHGLLDLHEHIDPYELRVDQPGAIDVNELRRQAHERDLLDTADVVVLAGRAYAELASAVWPHARRPLDGAGGIGYQLARLSRLADPDHQEDLNDRVKWS